MTLEEVNDNEDISVSKTIEILDKSNHEIQETLEKVEKTRNQSNESNESFESYDYDSKEHFSPDNTL